MRKKIFLFQNLPAGYIEKCEFPEAHSWFKHGTEDELGEHVGRNVNQIRMKENRGDESPHLVVISHYIGVLKYNQIFS
jgi:hypothetical protein